MSGDGWWVKANPFPPKSGYPLGKPIQIPATAAYLIIAERHVMPVERLTSADWAAVGALFEAIWERESLPGGIVGMRFGHPTHSGTTIIHRHFHVIVPPEFPEGMEQPDPEKPLLVVPVPFWAG
ncbi:MAG: hypothetical protein HY473_02275 [Candidatus Sungbacteria bacterium]|uniref:HIT domain-containing protein n=1 Tax=Candidatus Sungiibacteriota bacterium TaxID=2750080 RepID=A0A932YWR8_9BACT|nr:hypothetical protein [Candidatus Sungbacteria bacterium]